MKNKKGNTIIHRLWKWLEKRFNDTDAKLDHIIFRIREEDPRIYEYCHGKYQSEMEDDTEEDFKDI